MKFDQTELIEKTAIDLFGTPLDTTKMELSYNQFLKWGYVYYPLDCVTPNREKKCLFHFVHHGCEVRAKNDAL